MDNQTDEPRTDVESPEDEGGPVKTFLEHLEDLRWVLIKSLVTLGVAFVVCLLAGHKVVQVLTYPLAHAKVSYKSENQVVTFLFGTNRLGVFQLPPSERAALGLGTNHYLTYRLAPVQIGTNLILGLQPDDSQTEANKLAVPLVSLSPAGAFIVAVQVAAYASILITSPFVLYFIASFVFPALKLREKRYIFRGLFWGLGLFLTGVAFCYFLLMPIALSASVSYTEWLGFGVPQWRAEDYISFTSKFMLGMGLGFEMPVVILVLVKIGVLNYRLLAAGRRYVIVISFIMGAVLTTPEVVTQVLMAVPLMVLYEISIWITWYWERQDRLRAAAGETPAD